MDAKIEYAKSWFVLAQMSIILAGFFFAIAGVSYTNSITTLNFAIDSIKKDISNYGALQGINDSTFSEEYFNLSKLSSGYYNQITLSNLNLVLTGMISGSISVLFGILFWIVGRYSLKNLKN